VSRDRRRAAVKSPAVFRLIVPILMVPIVLQPRLCFQEYGWRHHLALAGSHSTSGVALNCPASMRAIVWARSGELCMRRTIAGVALALALMSAEARAGERAGDAALGAVSGAVVLGPIGAVAGAVVGYTAGPSISNSWGVHRSSAPRQRRAASRDPRAPAGNGEPAPNTQPVPNQSAPRDQAAPEAAAPARPSTTTASSAPPVQTLE
jgi:hypothetical protein